MFGLILFISFLSYSTESQQNFVQQSSWMFNQRQIEKNQQPCHFKMIEKCFKRFEKYSNRRYSVGVLSEKEGLDDLCNTTQSTFNCLTDSVNQCGTPFHRELAKNIIKELSKTFKKFCEPGKLRDEFSKHAPCIIDEVLNTVNYKQDCYFPFLTSIGRTFTVKTIDHHLEVACCAYNKWQSCLFNKVTQKCEESGKNAMIYFTEKIFGEAPNRVCPANEFDHEGSKCSNSLEVSGMIGLETLLPVAKYLSTQLVSLLN